MAKPQKRVPVFRHSALIVAEILNGGEHWFENLYTEEWGEDVARGADDLLRRALRKLVDQWIDSGRDHRNRQCQTMSARDASKIPPGYNQSLFDILAASWLRICPRVCLLHDGTRTVVSNPPQPDPKNIESSTHELATYWVMELLQTPGAHSLACCENPGCQRYFEYERTPKRVIKRGTYCPDCKGKASALRVRESREKRRALRVRLAAELWQKWKPRSGSNRSRWIAGQMNPKLTAVAQIGRNGKWVTQNRDAILAEIERRTNGER